MTKCPKCKDLLEEVERYDADRRDMFPRVKLDKRVKKVYLCLPCNKLYRVRSK